MKGKKLSLVIVFLLVVLAELVWVHDHGLAAPVDAPAAGACAPTSWQAKVGVHGVRCGLARCTGSIVSCGSWGCAYGSVSGSSKTVYEGVRVWATVKRSARCGYSLRVTK